MPSLPWTGHYLGVNELGEPSWRRCCRCGRRLSNPESIERGIGPECIQEVNDQEADELRIAARENDRECWRFDAAWEAYHAAQAQHRYRVRPRLPDGVVGRRGDRRGDMWTMPTADAQERWERFQRARGRRTLPAR